MVKDPDAPPAAPSDLTATDNSPLSSKGALEFPPQPGEYKIRLMWQANSSDEAGFNIYRARTTTATWAGVSLAPQLVATVGPGVTTYIDKLGYGETPCTGTDQYCYYVKAYKNPTGPVLTLPGTAPSIIESAYSNMACAR